MLGREAPQRKFLPGRGRFDRRTGRSSRVPPRCKRERDRRQHGVRLNQHVVGGEAEHADATGRQKFRPLPVTPSSVRMKILPVFQLYGQAARGAEEIQVERATRMLPPKFVARQPAAAQVEPEQGFGFGRVTAELAAANESNIALVHTRFSEDRARGC
jgi:hypothetical protein